jgi:3-deoxy-manno-octulosonate cytidylyltransferase (CMP-KDO synthetase)
VKVIGIIPARFASTRFPGKPLVDIAGKTMIQRVLEQVCASNRLDYVLVATDDERIHQHVLDLGYRSVMTSPAHQSGTDRCAEALALSGLEADAVINIQGDEPLVEVEQLHQLIDLIQQTDVQIATLIKPIKDLDQLLDFNKVKVVCNADGRALYFSRQPIPMCRGYEVKSWLQQANYYKHLGLYAYRVEVLRQIVLWPPSYLEMTESLEQLRWLEGNLAIHTAVTHFETPSIDTPQDLEVLLASGKFG